MHPTADVKKGRLSKKVSLFCFTLDNWKSHPLFNRNVHVPKLSPKAVSFYLDLHIPALHVFLLPKKRIFVGTDSANKNPPYLKRTGVVYLFIFYDVASNFLFAQSVLRPHESKCHWDSYSVPLQALLQVSAPSTACWQTGGSKCPLFVWGTIVARAIRYPENVFKIGPCESAFLGLKITGWRCVFWSWFGVCLYFPSLRW